MKITELGIRFESVSFSRTGKNLPRHGHESKRKQNERVGGMWLRSPLFTRWNFSMEFSQSAFVGVNILEYGLDIVAVSETALCFAACKDF